MNSPVRPESQQLWEQERLHCTRNRHAMSPVRLQQLRPLAVAAAAVQAVLATLVYGPGSALPCCTLPLPHQHQQSATHPCKQQHSKTEEQVDIQVTLTCIARSHVLRQ